MTQFLAVFSSWIEMLISLKFQNRFGRRLWSSLNAVLEEKYTSYSLETERGGSLSKIPHFGVRDVRSLADQIVGKCNTFINILTSQAGKFLTGGQISGDDDIFFKSEITIEPSKGSLQKSLSLSLVQELLKSNLTVQ